MTELLGHIWRTAGEPVAVAGNVGTPLASLVGESPRRRRSSARPRASSSRTPRPSRPSAPCSSTSPPITSTATATSRTTARRSCASSPTRASDDVAVYNAAEPALAGARARRPRAARSTSAARDRRASSSSLPGPHNADNAIAAAVAARRWGSTRIRSREALATFPGVPHRLERVAEIDGVLYVNDSKATNVAAAVAALRSFDGGVRAILGGSLKGGGFEGLAEPVAERCVACYLIGEAAERSSDDLGRLAGVELPPLRRARRGRPRAAAATPVRARSSCSPRRARASTPTATTRSAASTSASWSRSLAMSAFSLGQLEPRTRTKSARADRVLASCSPRRCACSPSAS